MAIPGDRLSTTPVPAPFRSPDNRVVSAVVDWERGGIAISDPSQGMDVQDWRAYWEDGFIVLEPEIGDPVQFLEVTRVRQLSFAFDQNMRPTMVYSYTGVSYFRWYDSEIEDYRTDELLDVVTPRLGLDDKREMFSAASDIILAYVKNNSLYTRTQRERYEIETLQAENFNGTLRNIGMHTKGRMQFERISRS